MCSSFLFLRAVELVEISALVSTGSCLLNTVLKSVLLETCVFTTASRGFLNLIFCCTSEPEICPCLLLRDQEASHTGLVENNFGVIKHSLHCCRCRV